MRAERMTMRTLYSLGALAFLTLGVGCAAPQKVLIQNNYVGPTKSAKVLILDSGKDDPSTKKRLFHLFVRNCDLGADGTESNCKDTVILENVDPGSVY